MHNYIKKISAVLSIAMLISACPQAVSFAAQTDSSEEFDLTEGFEMTEEVSADSETAEDKDESVDEEEVIEISIPEVKTLSKACLKEYRVLSKLAVIEKDYEADKKLTRGELAALLCRLAGIGSGDKKSFSDVGETTKNAEAIQLAAGCGLIDGYGDGSFKPLSQATVADEAKALLKLAGYEKIAENNGGYASFAASLGWQSADEDSALTWQRAVKMMYSALFTELVELKGITGGELSYEKKDKIMLETLFGLTEGKGVVSAGYYAAIDGRQRTNEDEVVIKSKDGDWTYKTGGTDIADYIGYEVNFYYYGEDDYTIAVYIIDDKSTMIEIDEERYDDINAVLTELRYKPEGSKSVKTAKIASDADMIYNGVSYYGITKTDFENADMIRLVDSDGDGKYDVVHLTVYDVYFVDSASAKTNVISDKREGKSFYIDEEKYDVTYLKNGSETDLSMINEWDSVSIAASKPDSEVLRMTVVVSSDVISGYVDDIEADEHIVTVDGDKYFVSKKLNVQSMRGNIAFGIDSFGKIICFKTESNPEKEYGYLLKVKYGKEDDGYEIHMELMNMYGEIVTLPVTERFSINNKRREWGDLLAYTVPGSHDEDLEKSYNTTGQLIAYTYNNENAVKKIYMAIDDNGNQKESGAIDPESGNSLILNKKFVSKRMWDQYNTINGEYLYNSDTYCFKIITDANGKIIKELSGMFVPGKLNFNSGSTLPDVSVYDAGTSRVAKALVVKLPFTSLTSYSKYSTQALIVDKVVQVLNSDNEVVSEIRGYHSGSYKSMYIDENVSIDTSNWKRGDMFIVHLSASGKILTALKFFSMTDTSVVSPDNQYTADNPAMKTMNTTTGDLSKTTSYAEILNIAYGYVKEVINSETQKAVRIQPIGIGEDVIYRYFNSCIYIYHRDSKTIESATMDDISRGIGSGTAVIYSRYGNVRDIMIID